MSNNDNDFRYLDSGLEATSIQSIYLEEEDLNNQWGDTSIEYIIRKYYGGTISSIFSVDNSDDNNVSGLASHRSDEILHNLHFFDHRYIRFIYNPISGKFVQNNFWKDPAWVSVDVLKKGIDRETHNEREIIFGQNLIDIKEKSTVQLLIDETLYLGESIPVSKLPIDDTSLNILDLTATNVRPEVAKHFLFSGTKIVRVRRAKNGAISFSADAGNISDDDGALAMVVPLMGFLISTYNFIRLGVNAVIIILRALDLITIVVPPALPATMSIGTNFAIGRLKKAGIFCISPPRVNVGGKLNVMCFDKTGTLTEDGLDVLGVRFINQTSHSDGHKTNNSIPPILCAMTTCHSLKLVNGELIGDPLDLKMFDFTKWILEESGQGVSSSTLRLSTGSAPSGRPGSPTNGTGSIVPTVVRPPNSKQFDLNEALNVGGKNGDGKPTPFIELGIIRTFEFVSSLRRMSVLVKRLRNQTIEVYVKGAPEVMRDICRADSCDNVLTAISVSRECGLVNKASKVYVPRFVQGSSLSSRASISWESLDNPKDSLDSTTLKQIISISQDYPSEYPFISPYEYDLAVTGDVFRWIIDYGDEMTFTRMLVKGQIFARMSPDEKHELVEKLQEIGYCVGFCGDGANDCGALKAADVGLSLSDAEASVAAPFTSRNMDIGCVIEVI
ncbi:8564_t:CDS:10, partial [Racocetra fulgida]